MKQEKRKELNEAEINKLLAASKKGRHGSRDYAMLLLAFRHGFRVSELIDLRLSEIDLDAGQIYVRRAKGSRSGYHMLEGDEMRALRRWLRDRALNSSANSDYVFLSERGAMVRQAFNYTLKCAGERAGLAVKVHPHMLRHSTGFHLANKGTDTRTIQDYLGHANIANTVRYTRIAPKRFKGLFR